MHRRVRTEARRQDVVLTYKGESMPGNVATLDIEGPAGFRRGSQRGRFAEKKMR
jgi:hypothetical protein